MTKCTESGCRNLQTICADCGRIVCTKTFSAPGEWISVKDDIPIVGDIVLIFSTDRKFGTMSGYRESIDSWHSLIPTESRGYIVPYVKFWMPLPKPPEVT
jgi:hypothetical protein